MNDPLLIAGDRTESDCDQVTDQGLRIRCRDSGNTLLQPRERVRRFYRLAKSGQTLSAMSVGRLSDLPRGAAGRCRWAFAAHQVATSRPRLQHDPLLVAAIDGESHTRTQRSTG